jgi:hydroxycarboxylate dehydrogenase B
MPTFTARGLENLTHLIATRMGSEDVEAREVADHLVRANLAGHDSHGVGMLPTYVRLLQDGLLVPNQTSETVLDSGALLIIDARRGYGQRAAGDAVRRGIAKAKEMGACVLGLRNASHIGRIGTYAELAIAHGCAFVSFVNVADHRDAQATWGAAEARLGTNPFTTGVPGPNGQPIVLDMATTTIAAGKARVAHNKGVPVPDGCLIDADGNPTNDPTGFMRDKTGALRSFGMHKGGGLAIMCEIMAMAVAGGQGTVEDRKGGTLNSMLATIIDLSRLGGAEHVAARAEATRAHIKSARPAPGFNEVLTPGEPERRYAAKRLAEGIDVDDQSWADIRDAASKVGITAAEIERAVGTNAG